MEYDEVYDAGLNLSSYWGLAVFWSSALIYYGKLYKHDFWLSHCFEERHNEYQLLGIRLPVFLKLVKRLFCIIDPICTAATIGFIPLFIISHVGEIGTRIFACLIGYMILKGCFLGLVIGGLDRRIVAIANNISQNGTPKEKVAAARCLRSANINLKVALLESAAQHGYQPAVEILREGTVSISQSYSMADYREVVVKCPECGEWYDVEEDYFYDEELNRQGIECRVCKKKFIPQDQPIISKKNRFG